MAKKRLVWLAVCTRIVVCAVVLAASILVFMALFNARKQPERTDRTDMLPTVVVIIAQPVPVQQQFEGYGTARAMNSADVPARVGATVVDIPPGIVEGAWVSRDDLLVALDDSDFLRQVEISRYTIEDLDSQLSRITIDEGTWQRRVELAGEQVELSQSELDRVTDAQKKGAAKQREVDQAKQALIAAIRDETVAQSELDKLAPQRTGLQSRRLVEDAKLRLAAQNVERCRILSPINGVVQTVDVELGENLGIGQRIARVIDLSEIEVPLRVTSSARGTVALGDRVQLRSTGDRKTAWPTTVARISPEDETSTRTMGVYAEITQDGQSTGGLAPGRFVRALITSSEPEHRWVVPRRAVEQDRILMVREGRIVSQAIKIAYQVEQQYPQFGVPDEQWVVLIGDLEPGVSIVLSPTRALLDGMAVEPVSTGETPVAMHLETPEVSR